MLIKDIWDIRTAKLRKSIDQMITKQERHAQVRAMIVEYEILGDCSHTNKSVLCSENFSAVLNKLFILQNKNLMHM